MLGRKQQRKLIVDNGERDAPKAPIVITALHSLLMTRTALVYGQASVADGIGQFRIAKRKLIVDNGERDAPKAPIG
ncbi:hypothetical protein M513_12359 [Trichuris suis]|uniref:Uncharacterized protein n=1 Tax=Trichuris suis TaxID=68888 RepID=A0A085LP82_9BILA|nr:hypothetical protein M513_12359 [Trichuris suis]